MAIKSHFIPLLIKMVSIQSQNPLEQKAKERKWRRTLASLQRLRLHKDDEESDARGDLSSAIVTSVALEEPGPTEASKTAPKVGNFLLENYLVAAIVHSKWL